MVCHSGETKNLGLGVVWGLGPVSKGFTTGAMIIRTGLEGHVKSKHTWVVLEIRAPLGDPVIKYGTLTIRTVKRDPSLENYPRRTALQVHKNVSSRGVFPGLKGAYRPDIP